MKVLLLLLVITMTGCDLFSTRTPENPSESKTFFLPPTEPAILVQNFESAVKNKNLENYLKCFTSNTDDVTSYRFFPSQSATTSFGSLFILWGTEQERRFFNSLSALITKETLPILFWTDRKAIIENPDSAVFESDYTLNINFSDSNIPSDYNGKIRLVMISDNNGLWSISKWYDYNLGSTDTIANSWSILKAKLYN